MWDRLKRLLSGVGFTLGTLIFGVILLVWIAGAVWILWLALRADSIVWNIVGVVVVVWALGIAIAFVRTMVRG